MSHDYLTSEQILDLIDSIGAEQIEFERIGYRNRNEIHRRETMEKEAFKKMILQSIEEGHQYGGDLELRIPSAQRILVGHHDGIYWLK
jgi:hypothetical protein